MVSIAGGRDVPDAVAEIPLQAMVKPMAKQVVPLQPMKEHARTDIHTAACGGPSTTAGGRALNEDASQGVPHWRRLLVGTAACGEESTQCRFSGRACDTMEDPHQSRLFL